MRAISWHYAKKMASRKVLHEKSVQSTACKKSVHVREIVRRILNTSSRLDWDTVVAPIITDYLGRMMLAGYSERYRKSCLGHAYRIHDKMKKEEEEGVRPIHRPSEWNKEERRIDKKQKRHTWSITVGYTAPIIIPATPKSELLQMLRDVAEQEAVPGLRFKILEKGGVTMKNMVQKSNPTATPGCNDRDCVGCTAGRGKGGMCRKGNVCYEMECGLCEESAILTDKQADRTTYIGETSRNLFTRGKEHKQKYATENQDSFILQHQNEEHDCLPADFTAKVTGTYRDCLSRQVAEGVAIRRCRNKTLNSKSEWHQPSLWKVRSELERA